MTYSDVVGRLRERVEMPLFAAAVWDPRLKEALKDATPETLFPGREIQDPRAAAAVLAGLRIWNDDFAGSHNLCQGIETPTGSYLHGICHRREGHRGSGVQSNLDNARHWFRQTGAHPAFAAVYEVALGALNRQGAGFRWATEAQSLLQQNGRWDPFTMIDWVDQAERGTLSAPSRALLEEIQWREIDALTDWCAQQALGE